MELHEFVLARIAEHEKIARACGSWYIGEGRWGGISDCLNAAGERDADHITRWAPARVLAECEVKRRIVIEWRTAFEKLDGLGRPARLFDPVLSYLLAATRPWLCALAALDADHPDYDPEWRP